MFSKSSEVQLSIRQRRMWQLLLAWLFTYFLVGIAFALTYHGLAPLIGCTVNYAKDCATDFSEVLYFSFTTQATVGYGDYAPVGVGRFISVVQAFVGTALNAVLLGVVVFKSLQRRTPIVFPEYLVYEFEQHGFWFRYVNIDHDHLQRVTFRAYLLTPLTSDESRRLNTYDTLTNYVALPFYDHPERVPLNVAAMRSVSNEGNGLGDRTPEKLKIMGPIVLSPYDFTQSEAQSAPITVTLEVSGYFRTNGEPFFAQKSYGISSIRCGAFKGINNHEVFRLKNRNERESHLKAVLNLTIPTPPDDCRRCPYHADCVFDVALATRNAPEPRASADPAIDPEMST